jgi:transcriptional regulator with XRE-family HTH domain
MTTANCTIADPTERQHAVALGQWLRGIRHRLGLSLQAVQEKSDGRWKSVVIGSYERGDRAISTPKLIELCGFYGINPAEFFATLESLPVPVLALAGETKYATAGRLLIEAIRTIPDLAALAGEPR